MSPSRLFLSSVVACIASFAMFCQSASANTLCVNPSGHKGCFTKIQDAVNFASNYDIVQVAPGTYNEQVTIGKPLSLLGAGADHSTIDASNLAHGIFVDGLDYPGIHDVIIAGFTIENAQYEGVLLLSASGRHHPGQRCHQQRQKPGPGIHRRAPRVPRPAGKRHL
jgi:pectin methylesterase-like acyl-CoA thioesterase